MAQNRKQQIIDSASRLIAQKGFEGLRTREIAEQVGINHATVHYHFADKEKLIEAVLQSVTEKIYQSDIEAPVSKNASATEKLATIFRNNLLQRQQYPERFTVLRELGMRANRDPRIERILSRLDEDLYAKMRAVLDSGVQSRDFRADLDTEQMAVMLITLLRGVKFQLDQEDINRYMRVYHQIEQDMLI
ncbi:MAG: TetR/AcrR family transcriptional regulator [Chloroflexota bacterium]